MLLAGTAATAGSAPAPPHLSLASASPAADDTLTAAPTEIRLSLTEAVNPALATLSLTGPEGEIGLADPERGETGQVVVVRILDGIRPGRYTVFWRVVGADGHPVAGELEWVVAEGAEGLAPARPSGEGVDSAALGPLQSGDASASREREQFGFDTGSPGYVLIRWVTFAALLGVLGAACYNLLVLPLAWRRAGLRAGTGTYGRSSSTVGLIAAVLLLVAAFARLAAQSFAVHGTGAAFDPDRVGVLLSGTLWGTGWILQVTAGLIAAFAFLAGRRGGPRARVVAALAALVLAFTPALSGHAAAVERLAPLPILADGLHVLAAGAWLGTLLVLLLVAVRPRVRAQQPEHLPLRSLVEAFSATALLFATVLVATGVVSAAFHLPSIPALWESRYGRVLLLKGGVLLPVFATGAYNWLRVRPAVSDGAGVASLRRSGWTELAVATLVLLVTAVLVATPTPQPAPAESAAVHTPTGPAETPAAP